MKATTSGNTSLLIVIQTLRTRSAFIGQKLEHSATNRYVYANGCELLLSPLPPPSSFGSG